jgi:hypothetical protein
MSSLERTPSIQNIQGNLFWSTKGKETEHILRLCSQYWAACNGLHAILDCNIRWHRTSWPPGSWLSQQRTLQNQPVASLLYMISARWSWGCGQNTRQEQMGHSAQRLLGSSSSSWSVCRTKNNTNILIIQASSGWWIKSKAPFGRASTGFGPVRYGNSIFLSQQISPTNQPQQQ